MKVVARELLDCSSSFGRMEGVFICLEAGEDELCPYNLVFERMNKKDNRIGKKL